MAGPRRKLQNHQSAAANARTGQRPYIHIAGFRHARLHFCESGSLELGSSIHSIVRSRPARHLRRMRVVAVAVTTRLKVRRSAPRTMQLTPSAKDRFRKLPCGQIDDRVSTFYISSVAPELQYMAVAGRADGFQHYLYPGSFCFLDPIGFQAISASAAFIRNSSPLKLPNSSRSLGQAERPCANDERWKNSFGA